MSLDHFFKRLDARHRIPRPANALHLDAYQAGVRVMRDAGEGAALVAAGIATSFVLWKIADIVEAGFEARLYFMIGMGIAVLIGLAEASTLVFPYYRISQRLTHGSARWADIPRLKEEGLAHDNRSVLPAGGLRLGRLTRRYDLALPFSHVLRHTAIFGPPGSGKSSTFIMSMAREWSRTGSAIFLDPKGELFRHTARHFRRVYRLDLADPRYSDRWNFVPACSGDGELANEIASIVVGFDYNKHYNGDPFWPQAETAILTALLLHLPRIADNPTPAMVAEFIAHRGFDEVNHEMKDSPDPEARIQWGIFKKADREKTQGGVFVGLGTKLALLRSPHAMAIMQSVTDEERERGIREIDLRALRKAGTGIYVVIPEGDATRYRIVLSILFGLAASVVRKTSHDDEGAPVLLALDEAGNIPLHNLSEALGVGRGRRCGIVLGYQNIGQLYKQYGRDGAQSILGSIGSMVFLPGLDAETAQYAARRIGRTTVLQQTSVDAIGNLYDNERLSETGRDLLDAAELRQMAEHTQAVAIIGSAPPVKFGFPPCAKDGPAARPLPRDIAQPVPLEEAEAAFARRRSAETQEPLQEEAESPSEGAVPAGVADHETDPGFEQATDASGDQQNIDAIVDALLKSPSSSAQQPGATTSPAATMPLSRLATDSDASPEVTSILENLSLRRFGESAGTEQATSTEKEKEAEK